MEEAAHSPPMEIGVQNVKELFDADAKFLLLDCREPDEFEFAKITGSTLIPLSEIANRVDELEPYRDWHVIAYCHHGMRSLRVTRWLRQQGFKNVQNMAGGIEQWAVEVDPSVPRY